MSVDANVLINERIREETKLGRTPMAALERASARAFGTIFDCQMHHHHQDGILYVAGHRAGEGLRRHDHASAS